jgi:hypothetical protein
MKNILLIATILLAGCQSQPKPAALAPESYSKLPTATEVFNLRTKCTQLAQQLDESLPYGASWRRQTVSNYSAKSNRCYVELYDSADSIQEYTRDLYDGQTRDLLAYTKTDGPVSSPHGQVGQIFIDSNIDTLSDCHEGGDCGYAKVNTYIDERMKREER